MKKIVNFLLTSIYVFILMILSVWLFWELHGKDHCEKYIKDNYGTAIIETNNNSRLSLKLLKNDS